MQQGSKKDERKLQYDTNKDCVKAYCKNYYRNHKYSEISRVNLYNARFTKKVKCARNYYVKTKTILCASKRPTC